MLKTIVIFLLSEAVVGATIIPSDRTPTTGTQPWAGIVGMSANSLVPSGIPNRTTTNATLTPSATTAQINSAIQSCPPGQVVYLSPGTYHITGEIDIQNNLVGGGDQVTLRGAGPGVTILDFGSTSVGNGLLNIQGFDRLGSGFPDANESTNETNMIIGAASGYTQGSTNLVLSKAQSAFYLGTPQELKVGTCIVMDQLNDTNWVNQIGKDSTFAWTPGPLRNSGARAQQQYFQVTAITSGTNLTVWPPVMMTNWSSGLQPQIWWGGTWAESNGIENLTIEAKSSSSQGAVLFWGANHCWLKNCVIHKPTTHAYIYNGIFDEIRDCYFNDNQGSGSGSYGLNPQGCGSCLFVNNAFNLMTSPIVSGGAVNGCAFAYNFATNGIYISTNNTTMPASYEPHFVHSAMNLWEGNYGTAFKSDFIHGSSSHDTLFRNRLHGKDYSFQSSYLFTVEMQATNRNMNVIANVLGTTGNYTNYLISMAAPDATDNCASKTIYKLGFVDDTCTTNNGDPLVATTVLIHGNWDAVTATNGGIVWDANTSDHSPPSSYLYASKPAWWGNGAWPPFDPASPGNTATNLPSFALLNLNSPAIVYGVTLSPP